MEGVAKRLGVSRQSVYYWEQGRQPIPKKRLDELSILFNIPKEYLNEITDSQAQEIDKLLENVKYIEYKETNRTNSCNKLLERFTDIVMNIDFMDLIIIFKAIRAFEIFFSINDKKYKSSENDSIFITQLIELLNKAYRI